MESDLHGLQPEKDAFPDIIICQRATLPLKEGKKPSALSIYYRQSRPS
jgi:hypothetical protein